MEKRRSVLSYKQKTNFKTDKYRKFMRFADEMYKTTCRIGQ